MISLLLFFFLWIRTKTIFALKVCIITYTIIFLKKILKQLQLRRKTVTDTINSIILFLDFNHLFFFYIYKTFIFLIKNLVLEIIFLLYTFLSLYKHCCGCRLFCPKFYCLIYLLLLINILTISKNKNKTL